MKLNIFKNKRTMNIKIYGDEVLTKVAIPVDEITKEIIELSSKMEKTMIKNDGVGLAAPQVGISLRMFILGVPTPTEENLSPSSPGELLLLPRMPITVVNPEVTVITDKMMVGEEGCLSIPQLYARVIRPERVMLSAQLLNGEKINVECAGFLARAIQHEMDHLDGVLFVDRLEEDEYKKIKSDLKQIKRGKRLGRVGGRRR